MSLYLLLLCLILLLLCLNLFLVSLPGSVSEPASVGACSSRFYTLMVLSTALFDKPAFKNLVCNGLVLAADGKKMSKRLLNYPVRLFISLLLCLPLSLSQPFKPPLLIRHMLRCAQGIYQLLMSPLLVWLCAACSAYSACAAYSPHM